MEPASLDPASSAHLVGDECAICLEEFPKSKMWKYMGGRCVTLHPAPTGSAPHDLHTDCVLELFKRAISLGSPLSCPICQTPLSNSMIETFALRMLFRCHAVEEDLGAIKVDVPEYKLRMNMDAQDLEFLNSIRTGRQASQEAYLPFLRATVAYTSSKLGL